MSNVLNTQRLLLRPLTLDDASVIAKLANNKAIYDVTGALPYPYTNQDAIGWIQSLIEDNENKHGYDFAIVEKETGLVIGVIGISNDAQHHRGEIGYWLGQDYWGKGYMSEAIHVMIEFAFNKLKYHKLYADVYKQNKASANVLTKAGFKYCGSFIDHYYKDGQYISVDHYEILNDINL